MKSTQIITVITLTLLAIAVDAWGPLTHQTQGRLLNNSTWFVVGSSAPDAFAYIHKDKELHSFSYAGYQLKYALRIGVSEWIEFSSGYAAHLAQDLVAHSPHGYPTCKKIGPDMMELQIDTYEYVLNGSRPSFFDNPKNPWIAEFISNVTSIWGTKYSPAQIREWEDLFDVAFITESEGIPFNRHYQETMIENDPYGATSWPETLGHLNKNLRCSQNAAALYIDRLFDPEIDENVAEHVTREQVQKWYDSGLCTP